jgi:quinone-modifying oxidoreductase, subunit QmoB
MDKKTGVYICTGCDIGESLDIAALSKVATKEGKVPVCKTHSFLCGSEGLALIKSDIESEGVNTVVIAACSPRVNCDVFDFGSSIIMERTNLREQITWCHPANDEDGFIASDSQQPGIYGAGCVKKPLDVASSVKDSTAAALKAIQSTVRR